MRKSLPIFPLSILSFIVRRVPKRNQVKNLPKLMQPFRIKSGPHVSPHLQAARASERAGSGVCGKAVTAELWNVPGLGDCLLSPRTVDRQLYSYFTRSDTRLKTSY